MQTGQKIVALRIAVVSIVTCIGAQDSRAGRAQPLPAWIREHVGVSFYAKRDAGDTCTMEELVEVATQLGCPGVMTWVDGSKPGDLLRNLQTPVYQDLLRRFRFVKLNLCQAYIGGDYDYKARPMSEAWQDVENDWYETTRFLITKLRGQRKTLILSYGQELNVYFGQRDSRPDFPVADYVAAGHRGMRRAIGEAGRLGGLEVFDLAEVQFYIEFSEWVDRFVPHLTVDLFGLTYYPNGMTLTEQLDYLAARAPRHAKFGNRNIVLSEFGTALEQVYWDESKQLRYMRDTLREARNWGVPYAFWFQLTDTDFVMRVAGFHGLCGHKDFPVRRLTWDYLSAIFNGKDKPKLPKRSPEETMQTTPAFRSGMKAQGALPDLVISRLEWKPPRPRSGDRVEFTVGVKNVGAVATLAWNQETGQGTILANVEVDGHYLGYGMTTGPLATGEEVTFEIIKWSTRAYWTATKGRHVIGTNVNAKKLVIESDHTAASNALSRKCLVK
ncbi:MAG: hypothetical protein HY318_18595 [Armatimonadetes bacterium]|nr:hypothetical protein [Armatimonadota bacterium]